MSDLDHNTRVRFSLPQLVTILLAIIGGTWTLNEAVNGLRVEVRAAASKLELTWSREDMDRWVWLTNQRNPKFVLPYPIELRTNNTAP